MKLIHSGNLGYPRDARPFLKGLRMYLDQNPDARIQFTVLGNPCLKLEESIQEFQLEEYVEYKNPVEYNKSLSILTDYDVAVIIEADCEEGIFLPTKVSDFLQQEIPIFSISPSVGTLSDLYKERAIPYYAPISDVYAICEQIGCIWNDYMNNQLGENARPPETFLPEFISNQYVQLSNI